ncbi:ubiquinol-cytochrome-c reductase complex assembly factor 5 isoform X2 [Eptesicus fuscus]|uniref:ubiquinol-cytochrome-c reductase complex assembly factor 5 isoform X2 n=1 Tax=Eptesicus fuscus TaxID=29078 RepID=UPI0024041D1E|nr:ubiquinol-cytochrome-c reductase complex assembly factor 5 isoform X2 [Eptesicus fuscus]
MFSRAQVRRVLQWVPGKQRLGVYRFLPFFFVLGGTMEWIMIQVRVGQETFYDVYRRKASERQYQRRLEEASETELQQSIKFSQLLGRGMDMDRPHRRGSQEPMHAATSRRPPLQVPPPPPWAASQAEAAAQH